MGDRGRGKIFSDVRKLNEMLNLRRSGIGPSELAERYGVDHSTIVYHARKHSLILISGSLPAPKPVIFASNGKISIAFMPDGTEVNQGMDYADYLRHQEEKRWRELLEGGKHRKK